MAAIICSFLYLIVFHSIHSIQSLEEIPIVEDYDIISTELYLRKTVNNLFIALKLKTPKKRAKLKQFSKIHNFFTSITLGDQENLKRITSLVKVDSIPNNTQYFITQLNEVLNDDDKNNKTTQETSDAYVEAYIKTFVQKLEDLKGRFGLNARDVDVNLNMLKQISLAENQLKNMTETEDDDNVLSSENEFWEPSTEHNGRRIFEGTRTRIRYFPFMAVIQFFGKFQCAGSIIKKDLVITAASCLQLAWNNLYFRENPAFLSVRVGTDFFDLGGESISVSEIRFHPSYNPSNLNDNLAILRLRRLIHFRKDKKRVKRIVVDQNPWTLPLETPGVTIVGWGARGASNILESSWRNRLSYDVLDVYLWKDCREIYKSEYVTLKNFCAGYLSKGGGACNHDVGAPGIVGEILVGVVSFGSPVCGAIDAPTVFTKLGYYTDWIQKIMKEEVRHTYMQTTTRRPKTTPGWYRTIQESFTITPVPATNIEPGLRTRDKYANFRIFKEFLSTIFGSEEFEQIFGDDHEPQEEEVKSLQKVETTTVSEGPILRDYGDDYLSMMMTKIDDFEAATPFNLDRSLDDFNKHSRYKTSSEYSSREEKSSADYNIDKIFSKNIKGKNYFDKSDLKDLYVSLSEEVENNKKARNRYSKKSTPDYSYVENDIPQNTYLFPDVKIDLTRTGKPMSNEIEVDSKNAEKENERSLTTVRYKILRKRKKHSRPYDSIVALEVNNNDKGIEESRGMSIEIPENTLAQIQKENRELISKLYS